MRLSTQLIWLEKYQWKWVIIRDLSKFLDNVFGLNLELHDVDQFLVDMIKAKLKYWSSTHLFFSLQHTHYESCLDVIPWYFIEVWVGFVENFGKIKVLLHK